MRKTLILALLALFIITPFSRVLAVSTDYRYTGKPLDSGSNLYYYGQRYYDPMIGQFTQPDPVSRHLTDPQKLKQSTGQDLQQFLTNPQALNEYSYTQNNPVKYVDPDGEFLIPAALAVAGLVFSGVFLDKIKVAQAPTANSTPKVINDKSAGDLVPGVKKLDKSTRWFAMLGLNLAFSKASAGKQLISIFHGTSDDAVKGILKSGWKIGEGGGAFFSNLKSTGEWFAQEKKLEGLVGKIMELNVPGSVLSSFQSKGLLEITNLANGEKYYNFTKSGIDQLIKLSKKAGSEIKLLIHNIAE